MTEKSLVLFQFEAKTVRTITDDQGEPWFVLSDVLDAMGTSTTTTNALASIEQGLGKGYSNDLPLETAGGIQQVVIIAEAAATYLVARSNTEKGRRLNRFIHAEVLPQIRRTGSYATPKTPAELLLDQAQRLVDHERKLAAMAKQQRALAREVVETAAQVDALVHGEDYWTVVGYGNLIGEKVDLARSQRLGRIASRICREHGWCKASANHPVFGPIGSYPRQAVALAFDQEGMA